MVSFTILYLISLILASCVFEFVKSNFVEIAFIIVIFLMRGNMTTYVWLMFYYYIMIVLSQRASNPSSTSCCFLTG